MLKYKFLVLVKVSCIGDGVSFLCAKVLVSEFLSCVVDEGSCVGACLDDVKFEILVLMVKVSLL